MKISFLKFLHAHTGPGGWHCGCCGPAPRHKKQFVRRCKKRFNRMIDRFHQER